MTDRTTKAARDLASRAEHWAELAADRHNAAYHQDALTDFELWAGCIGIGLTYAVCSLARMFTQEDQ